MSTDGIPHYQNVRGLVGDRTVEAHQMHEDEIVEGTEATPAEVARRIGAAIRYLGAARPGARLSALLALYRAATDMEGLTDWRVADATRHFRLIPSSTRAALRGVVGALATDPDRATVGVARVVYERLIELEGYVTAKSGGKRWRGRRLVRRS